MYCCVLNWMSTDVLEVRAASIIRTMSALTMEATRTFETSADIQLRTRQYIPEDSDLHTRRRDNLKSHFLYRVHKSPPLLPFELLCCTESLRLDVTFCDMVVVLASLDAALTKRNATKEQTWICGCNPLYRSASGGLFPRERFEHL
jgi:hypothetical protein